MSSRADTLAERVQQANDALRETVEQSTPDQWRARCADGEWTQGFAAFHAANSIALIPVWVGALANGEPFTPVTFEQIDQMNAGFHAENAGRTREETLEAIRANSPASVEMVRNLSDEQLDRKVAFAVGVPEMSVEQVIEMLMVGHPEAHRASIVNAR
jgi:hypothetical protein